VRFLSTIAMVGLYGVVPLGRVDGQRAPLPQVANSAVLNLPIRAVPRGATLREQQMMRVGVTCDDTLPGRRIVRLAWSAKDSSALSRRVDVTPYPNGFEKGLYSIAYPLQSTSRESHTLAGRSPAAAADRALAVTIGPPRRLPGTDSIAVEMDGLRPGLIYQWRVLELVGGIEWRPTATARARVPLCTTDAVRPGRVP
jgi:hypothetical protein